MTVRFMLDIEERPAIAHFLGDILPRDSAPHLNMVHW
jgi:hypothetical protein